MNFEPQKFFVGIIDFFSILLPGALLTYLAGNEAWKCVLGPGRPLPNGTEGSLVFLFASYLLGHFIFLLSTWLDEFDNWVRKATLDRQIKQLAWHGWLMPRLARWLVWLAFKRERHVALKCVCKIQGHYLGNIGAAEAINCFQWCKARLAIEHPELLATVKRFEADSKFFRSLVVVLFVLIYWYAWQNRFGLIVVCAVLLLMALWRYMEQRHKAINQVYWSVLTIEGKGGSYALPTDNPSPDEPTESIKQTKPTHAGGIVYKGEGEARKYLLVQAKKKPNEWVLPKGHIESGEHTRETAVREVQEETGVWAEIVKKVNDMGITEFTADGKKVCVQFYIMKAKAEDWSEDSWREHDWLPLEKAKEKATHDETKHLLEEAKIILDLKEKISNANSNKTILNTKP